MGFFSTLVATIYAYTGLSPMGFFTILALMVGVYHLVSGMFVSPEEVTTKVEKRSSIPEPEPEPELPAEPVQIGEVTLEELKAYDGSNPKKPLLVAIKGNIYDVSRSRMFYGPGGPYSLFAGRDASRALALMSFDHNDLTGNLEGLSDSELDVLQDWEEKFMEKYVKVGQLAAKRLPLQIRTSTTVMLNHCQSPSLR
ncbi:hypothetical protein HPP92_013856 [Vanilla planifolia]|uniref:Cytochrome b5 heme-binding domain-containing protein n=1 Tax=Vanilla planifolia TaxID=51239 RepID=A0A835UYV5_VANPL|nr:hypothetical protein HPP92_014377 [Vanilla planifolia]KAG0479137.1 hypothetical protein HPP92_013856 [Vanilla planifolia]